MGKLCEWATGLVKQQQQQNIMGQFKVECDGPYATLLKKKIKKTLTPPVISIFMGHFDK